jgi:LmbE family N-acetylglucosaminyl deacetylase
MKALFLHAHFDDYEFTAAGTFARWQQALGHRFQARVVVCTDGKAGHQFRTRAATGRLRLREQRASARLGRYDFRMLELPGGGVPREACLLVTRDLLAALWKAIRDFEPDYLFCPPLPADPLAGVHVDHLAIAQAVRQVAYMINVPHAFTPEYPADETKSQPCKVPVILTVYDGYMAGANAFDLGVDVEPVFDDVAAMAHCHQSQIKEWLPWVGRHRMTPPDSIEAWRAMLRTRFERRNRELGLRVRPLAEVFSVTAWGEVPTLDQLEADFPPLLPSRARWTRLGRRLRRWRGE